MRTEKTTPNCCRLALRLSRWVICVIDAAPKAKYLLRRNQTVRIPHSRLYKVWPPTRMHAPAYSACRRLLPSVLIRSYERTSASRGSAH